MNDPEFIPIGCAIITVSDSRTVETDTSGALLATFLGEMGHRVEGRCILPDDIERLRGRIAEHMADRQIDAVFLTGGTGLTRRDITPETIEPLATKAIPGFGELFRWLSYRDIGSSTIQSRAGAWLCEGTLVFALPGSTNAVRLALEEILREQLDSRHRPCNFVHLLPRIRPALD
jgi:molybdenum cofactor biosynthesis protein B